MQIKRVLFLCSGNYYRSRFAEELFNYRARVANLNWMASSRALALERGAGNVGPISPFAIEALKARNIVPTDPARLPVSCRITDLEEADLVVAMKEAEHRPIIKAKFSTWADRVTYWHVHDIDVANPKDALKLTEIHVSKLIEKL
ncbi:low molecular weight phosphatase family protein [Bradyrhizobium sediminis]|uniref:Low molecular weight phosphatase family protein n=1 Tax=Bradyrhizobium sediminis TaxID=2840469 RepID=A0A975RNX9_9BRAD|nr:low molecular weight phosphatase family protein [Bradyrhizobium sediminis]QWG14910.1 low molecular weight phosphatase family protein [Bradyrhizobium sediminis]